MKKWIAHCKQWLCKKRFVVCVKPCAQKGQGVIEYVGAMMVAAILVATLLPVATNSMESVYSGLMSGLQSFFGEKAAYLVQLN